MLARFCQGLVDLLAPPRCAACETLLAERSLGFCGACAPLIDRLELPEPGDDLVACVYGGPLADAVHRLKYGGASWHAQALAELMRPFARSLVGHVDLVTAIPLHPARLRQRGFNQAVLLARPLADAIGVPFRPRALTRLRSGTPQVGASRMARAAQVRGTLEGRAVTERRVLVVDDVRTSGATLGEAKRALYAAGARSVVGAALAQTPEDGPRR